MCHSWELDIVSVPSSLFTSRHKLISFEGEVPVPENRVVGDEIAVGSDTPSFQFGSEFLRSTSLALLVIYEAGTFLVFFVRLASCILAQYNIEDRAASEWEGIMFRGLGWLVVGAKLSAIETAAGFATTSFGVILTRRVLRMIGRACIIIGVIKGFVYPSRWFFLYNNAFFRPDRKEEFLILDTDKVNEFLTGTRKLRLSGVRANISSPRLVQSTMARRLSQMLSLRQSRATFPSRAISPIVSVVERSPGSSRRSSLVLLDQPTRKSSMPKSRPAPLILERKSSESHVSVVRNIDRAPTLVLRLSPMNLPGGDMLAAMSAKWTDTATINYVGVDPIPFSAHSAPPPRFTGEPSGLLSVSPESEGVWVRERSRIGSSRRSSLPPAVPPLPPDVSRSPTPTPTVQPARDTLAWPPTKPELEPASKPELEPEPSSAMSAMAGSPPESGGITRQRSGRSRRTGSASSFGDMSIDWIVPESSSAPGRFKGIGSAPIRTMQTPTSAAAVRSSVAVERQEESPRERREGGGGGGSRRERARRDSGVLGMEDLARVRRSMQTMI